MWFNLHENYVVTYSEMKLSNFLALEFLLCRDTPTGLCPSSKTSCENSIAIKLPVD